ncbi:hypothetical protein QOZ80_4BG0342850 [Eleusine coracana subsp. coracana]|nr:hypothetical protein QOZ80_4BG0342850 [Eleusine coracana subsp. coracana]
MASNGADGTPADARQCICSPTTHPGSFRCRLHRGGGGGMPRSASCQQFVAIATGAPGSFRSGHVRRAASQQQLAHANAGGGMTRSASEQQFLRSRGFLLRSASWQDFAPTNKEY